MITKTATHGQQQTAILGDHPAIEASPVLACFSLKRGISGLFLKLEKNHNLKNMVFFKFAKIHPNATPVHRNEAALDKAGCGVAAGNVTFLMFPEERTPSFFPTGLRTDRQTGRQTDRQACRPADKQADRQAARQIDGQTV